MAHRPDSSSPYSTTQGKAVLAFSEKDVYIASNGALYHWDGTTMTQRAFFLDHLPPFEHQIQCMWGTDSTNLYLGGLNGAIYHVNGSNWQLLQTGSDYHVEDIYGGYNPKKGSIEVLAVAEKIGGGSFGAFFDVSGSTVTALPVLGNGYGFYGVLFVPGVWYIVAGLEVFETYGSTQEGPWYVNGATYIRWGGKFAVRGNNARDYFVLYGNEVFHFNGLTWKILKVDDAAFLGRLSVRGDFIALAGTDGAVGVVTFLKR